MSLLCFWALIVLGSLLSIEGQRAHLKHLHLCSEDERRSYWNDVRVNYPCSDAACAAVLSCSWDTASSLETSIINPNENRKHLARVLDLPCGSDVSVTVRDEVKRVVVTRFSKLYWKRRGAVSRKTPQSPSVHKWMSSTVLSGFWVFHKFSETRLKIKDKHIDIFWCKARVLCLF